MISLLTGNLNNLTVFDLKNMTVTNIARISGTPPSARGAPGFTSIGDAIYLHGGRVDGQSILQIAVREGADMIIFIFEYSNIPDAALIITI